MATPSEFINVKNFQKHKHYLESLFRAGVLASGVLMWAIFNLKGTEHFGLHRPVLGFLIFVIIIASYCSALIFLFGSKPLADWQWVQMRGMNRWGAILISISAGFCEELIYRGYMMTALKRVGQPLWIAMTLSTISFILFHGMLPIPFMMIGFLIGLMFAGLYQKTSNLWVPVYVHALWDATVLLVPMSSGNP